mmetsp:Transcript_35277/g.75152  ORF Transcript_35277/g.75152 Transcript_35277/m.75152 type:complete len:217 (+) Transcript_35277:219-869(+)
MASLIAAVSYFGLLTFFALGVGCVWPEYVDGRRAQEVRVSLRRMLVVLTSIELMIWSRHSASGQLLLLIIFCIGWGAFDAVQRYPALHPLDSFFTVKQAVLLLVHALCFIRKFPSVPDWSIPGLITGILCMITPVLMLFVGFYFGEAVESQPKGTVIDEDIFFQAFAFLFSGSGRQRLQHALMVPLAKAFPSIQASVLQWDPTLKRHLEHDKQRKL